MKPGDARFITRLLLDLTSAAADLQVTCDVLDRRTEAMASALGIIPEDEGGEGSEADDGLGFPPWVNGER